MKKIILGIMAGLVLYCFSPLSYADVIHNYNITYNHGVGITPFTTTTVGFFMDKNGLNISFSCDPSNGAKSYVSTGGDLSNSKVLGSNGFLRYENCINAVNALSEVSKSNTMPISINVNDDDKVSVSVTVKH